jgi:hypothetical protein
MGKCKCIIENCESSQFSYKLGEVYQFKQVDDFWGSYFFVFTDLSKNGFNPDDFTKYFEIVN